MWAIRPKPQLSLNSSGRYKPAFIGTLTEHAPAGTKVSFQFRSATNAQEKAPDFQNRSKGLTFYTPSRRCQKPLATDRPASRLAPGEPGWRGLSERSAPAG